MHIEINNALNVYVFSIRTVIIYSYKFILAFFLLFWLHWLLCRNKTSQNCLLLIASYIFYGMWDWKYVPLLFLISLAAYGAGIYFRNNPKEETFLFKSTRWWVSLGSIIFCLAILGYFKYCDFFLQSMHNVIGFEYKPLEIILPVGVSFYTFSAISYIVDSYQKKIEPTTDLLATLLYASFFPAILSGPIHKATDQLPQWLNKRDFDYDLVNQGFKDYVWGVFMKLCVAERLGMYVDAVYSNIANHSGNTLFFTSVVYTLQIYADFAGYSLMAIGCGKMLGIKLQNNFNLPYFSKTITEFWSKWHMSLTGWFKNYVYFPLGGNRVNKPRWILNIMIVFLLSGLWHGAAYTFIIWGAIHGIAQVVEKLLYGQRIKNLKSGFTLGNVLRTLLTFFIVSFAWIFFRMPDVDQALSVIEKIFRDYGEFYIDPTLILGIASLIILIVKDSLKQANSTISLFQSKYVAVRFMSLAFIICFILLFGVLEGGQFIYFQF